MKTRLLALGATALAAIVGLTSSFAATSLVVTPAHTNGWYAQDVRPGGEFHYISDPTSPYPSSALQLKTDSTTGAKVQYMHDTTTPLSSVNELAYQTKQVSGPPEAAASYQMAVDLNGGAAGGFTTFVYEPYWNGAVVPMTWQQWDVDQGQFWSSRTVSDGACSVVAGAGGPPLYTLAQIKTMCPNAVVVSYGVNVGTFNPNYNVEVDGFNFNGTVYNFELTNAPSDKEACKDGSWQNLTRSDGTAFRNQGDCVSYTNTGR